MSVDVMVDGMVAEHTKRHPQYSTDLQSLLWGSLSLFAVGGFLTSGLLITSIGPVGVFSVLVFIGIVIFIPGAFNWLGETKRSYELLVDDSVRSNAPTLGGQDQDEYSLGNSSTGHQKIQTYFGCIQVDLEFVSQFKRLLLLAGFISGMALAVGAVVLVTDTFAVRITTVLTVAVLVVTVVLLTTKAYYSPIGKTGLFFFCVTAFAPETDTAMFYWYTDYEGGPQFSPRFVGFISALSFAAMFVGILVYNRSVIS